MTRMTKNCTCTPDERCNDCRILDRVEHALNEVRQSMGYGPADNRHLLAASEALIQAKVMLGPLTPFQQSIAPNMDHGARI